MTGPRALPDPRSVVPLALSLTALSLITAAGVAALVAQRIYDQFFPTKES